GLAPALAGGCDGIGVRAVEQQHDSFIYPGIRRYRRAIYEKPYRGLIGIVAMNGEKNGLITCARFAPSAVGKEAFLPKRPQLRAEGVDPLFRRGLHHRTPTPLDGFFQQGRQNVLERPVQMIEEHLHHRTPLWRLTIEFKLIFRSARRPARSIIARRIPSPS